MRETEDTVESTIEVRLVPQLTKVCCPSLRSWIEADAIIIDEDAEAVYSASDEELQFDFCPFCGKEVNVSVERLDIKSFKFFIFMREAGALG